MVSLGSFSYEKKKVVLNKGPSQPQKEDMPNQSCPIHNNRSFLPSWYMKTMPDGFMVNREWLSYSVSEDQTFCIYCIVTGHKKNTIWSSTGFISWNKASERTMMYGTSSSRI